MSIPKWEPVATVYNPLKAGSIDGTDTVPHDHGVVRAMEAEYKPNKLVTGDPRATIFVGRLNQSTTEATLEEVFSRSGKIKKLRLIRDIVTGFSRRYAFIEFYDHYDAKRAVRDFNHTILDNKEILVDGECERLLPGWIPRRLGGGFGGKKESGQLRFGGKDRPFKKPIIVQKAGENRTNQRDDSTRHSRNAEPSGHSNRKDSDRSYRRGYYDRKHVDDEHDRHYKRDDGDRHYRKHENERRYRDDDRDYKHGDGKHYGTNDLDRHYKRNDYNQEHQDVDDIDYKSEDDRHSRKDDRDRHCKRDDDDKKYKGDKVDTGDADDW